MKNYLIVIMPDHSRWRISARFIAEHRAKYYAGRVPDRYQAIFVDEVAFAMFDDYVLKSWASNAMNWADVVSVAERLPDESVECDYERAWASADKEVLAIPSVGQIVVDFLCDLIEERLARLEE